MLGGSRSEPSLAAPPADEALRRAHEERARRLGRRLLATPSGSELSPRPLARCPRHGEEERAAPTPQQRSTAPREAGESARLGSERHRQVGALQNLRAALCSRRLECEELKSEQARLRRLLWGTTVEIQREHDRSARPEAAARAEAARLSEDCGALAAQLAAAQAGAQDAQRRAAALGEAAASARRAATRAAAAEEAARAELGGLQGQCRRLQAEVRELEEKFCTVSQSFQHAMDVSEKENCEVVRSLQPAAEASQRRAEKQRRRVVAARARLTVIRAGAEKRRARLRETAEEAARLREACRAAREEAELLQEERALEEAARQRAGERELQMRGGAMPAVVHERILRQQEAHYLALAKDLEDAMGVEQRLEAQARLDAEDELQRARAAAAVAEDAAVAAEAQRAALAQGLEAASAQLADLRASFEAERQARAAEVADLGAARERLAHFRGEARELGEELRDAEALAAHREGLEESLAAGQGREERLEEDLLRLRSQDAALLREAAVLRDQTTEAEVQLQLSRCQGDQLQKQQHAADGQCADGGAPAAQRLQRLVQAHGRQFKLAAAELKGTLTAEARSAAAALQADAARWRPPRRAAAARDGAATARLEAELDALQCRSARLREEAREAARGSALRAREAEAAGRESRLARGAAEAVATALAGVLPVGESAAWRSLLASCAGPPGAAAGPCADTSALTSDLLRGLEALKLEAADAEWHRGSAEWRPRLEESDDARARARDLRVSEEGLEAQASQLAAELLRAQGEARVREDAAAEAFRAQQERLATSEAACRRAAAMAEAALAEAEASEAGVEAAAEEAEAAGEAERAEQEACERLRREAQELSAALEELRLRLPQELRRRGDQWREHLARLEAQRAAAQQAAAASLREQNRRLALELRDASSGGAAAAEARATQVARLLGRIAEAERQTQDGLRLRQRLEERRGELARAARGCEEGLRAAEEHLAEVAAAEAADERRAEEEERGLTRRHEADVSQLRQRVGEEASRLEGAVRSSIGSLSAELAAGGDAALRAHAELSGSGERLAERARGRLGL